MQIVDFSFITALAAPRQLLAGEAFREALVAATADGEDGLSTSHHADRAYALQAAAMHRRRSRPGPLPDMRAAAPRVLDLERAED